MTSSIIGKMSIFVMLMSATENPGISQVKTTYAEISNIASTIERNVKKIFELYKDKQPTSPTDGFETYWTDKFTASSIALQNGINMQQFSDDDINRLALYIVLRESCRYEDIFKNIEEFMNQFKDSGYDWFFNWFYDEAIGKINLDSKEFMFDDMYFGKTKGMIKKTYRMNDAVERHMLINFLVFFVAKCHENNALVGFLDTYSDLLWRNIHSYKKNKNVEFVLRRIVNKFVNDKEVDANQETLKKLVETIYQFSKHGHVGRDIEIGFDKEFLIRCENFRETLPTAVGTKPSIESLIKNETFTAMFPKNFFRDLPSHLTEYTDLKLFLIHVSRLKMEECFENFRKYANKEHSWYNGFIGIPDKFRIKIKGEPAIIYKLKNSIYCLVPDFLKYNHTYQNVLHLRNEYEITDYEIEDICDFIGIKYENLESNICPISKRVMTRPVSFEVIARHYDLTSIVLYWIRFQSNRDTATFEFFDWPSNKIVDIRNFIINEGRIQSILTFYERAGNFSNHIEDYKFYASLKSAVNSSANFLFPIVTKFPSISQELKRKISDIEKADARRNRHPRADMGEGHLETDAPELNARQQMPDCEIDAIPYKKSDIVHIIIIPILEAEKSEEVWNKNVEAVREDLEDYRSQL